jgi:plasmid stabilization system protein ParE
MTKLTSPTIGLAEINPKHTGLKPDRLSDRKLSSTAKSPESGKKTDYKNIRIKIVSHYLIFYRIQEKYIEVVRIWDSRRDSKSFNL